MGAAVVRLPSRRIGKSFAAKFAQAHQEAFGPAPARPRRPAIPIYAIERANRCPDCHGEAFTVGRITAECAGCGLPLVIVSLRRPS